VLLSALSTASNPFTPVAPPADVLMLSQPEPSGSQRTDGIIGIGAAAALAACGDAALSLAGVGAGIANAPDNSAPGLRVAGALLVDEDAVEFVTNGPVSSEQPLAQPVAAGPTNVGEDGP
jgi:hypothetical protein